MNIAVIGFATEGKVSLEYFRTRGHDVTVCDRDESVEVPAGVATQLGEEYLTNLDRFDVVVRTAGMQPSVILEQNPGIESKITTAVNEFLAQCPTKNTIGVTGTKGKGTTSTLTVKMLEAAGHTVWFGGNIGNSPLEFIDKIQPEDWVVLELSSYQLSDITHATHIATCLLVVAEHLDWHGEIIDYVAAKKRLFTHQSPDDIAIYFPHSELSTQIASEGKGTRLPYYEEPGAYVQNDALYIEGNEICKVSALKLLGKHNWQNACAALTIAWTAGVRNIDALRHALTTFAGLPHRIEFVEEKDNIAYYNDSFATGLHATMAAVSAIEKPKVIVVGGYDRMLPLEEFAEFIAHLPEAPRAVHIFGQSGPRLAAAFDMVGYRNYVLDEASSDMTSIVQKAKSLAKPGDAVLFSPGFASFDMFKNFEDRGNQFRSVVESL